MGDLNKPLSKKAADVKMGHDHAKQQVREILDYCWRHTDTQEQEETLLWIAEHLSEELGDRYEFRSGSRFYRVEIGRTTSWPTECTALCSCAKCAGVMS